MNADDTFSRPAHTPRWSTRNLSEFLRDMHAQVDTHTRAIGRLTTRILRDAAQFTQPAELTSQAWQDSARAFGLNPAAQPIAANDPDARSAGLLPRQANATAIDSAAMHKPSLLRSIRWVDPRPDAPHPRIHLRLSGRLSDVCDELDRLVALEAHR